MSAVANPLCPACGAPMMRTGTFLNCIEPHCEYVPPIVFIPLTPPEPGSNRVVKFPARPVMGQQTMTEAGSASIAKGQIDRA